MSDVSRPQEGTGGGVGWLLKATGVVLWAFLIMGAYFWAHKPFDGAIVRGLGGTLLSIALWLGVSAIAAGLGYRVVGQYLTGEWVAARLALGAGAGLGFLSLLLLGLGLLGLFTTWAAALLLVLLLLLVRRDVWRVWQDVKQLSLPRPEERLQRWFLVYGAAMLALTFFMALAPPTAWDSLTYHLTGPKFYIEAGRIVHPVDIPHLGFPLLGQMHFALGMLLLGDGPAALFHFGYGLMALVMTVALARRAFDERTAWFSAAVFLSVPTLFTLMSWPYVDATLLFYATAAFYAFVRWREAHTAGSSERGWLLLLGVACGFAGSVKYTAVLIPMSIALSMAWIMRRQGLLAIARRLLPVALVSILLVLPHLLENWMTTGNPLYPFLLNDGRFWDAWRAWWYDRPGTGLAATAPWRLPLVPLEATILGTEGTEFYEATLGPLLLLSASLLLVTWRTMNREERAIGAHMLLFFGINYLFWLSGVARTALLLRARFLFFVFGVLAVLGGAALARLQKWRRPQLDVDWIVQVVVVLSLGLLLFTQTTQFLRANPLPVIAGLESRRSFEARRLGVYTEVIETVNELPPGAKVDFLWEARTYGCRVECWPDAILDRYLHYTQHYGFDAAQLADHWREEEYTHVLLYEAGLDFVLERGFDPVTERDLAILETLQEEHLTEVERWGDTYTLYALANPVGE
ncbi:MAG: ArnT family glycosyltransferase [bacterium]